MPTEFQRTVDRDEIKLTFVDHGRGPKVGLQPEEGLNPGAEHVVAGVSIEETGMLSGRKETAPISLGP